MAKIVSNKKRVRQSRKRAIRNKSARSQYKTYTARALKAVGGNDVEAAEQSVKQAIIVLDKTIHKGILHRNNAARHKSQLARKLNALRQKAQA